MLDSEGIALHAFFAALLHELGHITAIKICGGKINRLKIAVGGAEIVSNLGVLGYKRELIVCLAGPAVSIGVAVISALTAMFFENEHMYVFSGINMALGVFNLIPVPVFDGGMALRAIVLRKNGSEPRILKVLTYAGCASIFAVGLFGVIHGGFSLPLIAFAAWMLLEERNG